MFVDLVVGVLALFAQNHDAFGLVQHAFNFAVEDHLADFVGDLQFVQLQLHGDLAQLHLLLHVEQFGDIQFHQVVVQLADVVPDQRV
eukprot:CAMPEP_0116953264 /NCGR_PEP_ID=MMETSP0467-20121206/41223_1 /TAXON_ID=283647 /ORGANISM="Mesodinium pulex, Strain SPMC105" /LENGTH=86 /DNA_ID=CAMNT_0004638691 /DNA_START=235 /DNA_END=495 /DNA_ORIENTATION=+